MPEDTVRRRFESALEQSDPYSALCELARNLKREGMSQIEMYHLYDAFRAKLQHEDSSQYNAVLDTLDWIVGWGNRANWIFEQELDRKLLGARTGVACMPKLKSVSPISNEDASALPVKELGPAIAYYQSVLGFTVISRDATTAALQRDGARIGLVIKRDHQPNDAGSLAFAVDDLDALHRELSERGGKPGKFGTDKWGGKQFRTFFMREDENGYCYCFHHPVEDGR